MRVPPITGAGSRAASAQDALIKTVQLVAILDTLQILLEANIRLVLLLQPRLYHAILLVKVGHVRHEVLHDEHVRQGVNLGSLSIILDFATVERMRYFKQI